MGLDRQHHVRSGGHRRQRRVGHGDSPETAPSGPGHHVEHGPVVAREIDHDQDVVGTGPGDRPTDLDRTADELLDPFAQHRQVHRHLVGHAGPGIPAHHEHPTATTRQQSDRPIDLPRIEVAEGPLQRRRHGSPQAPHQVFRDRAPDPGRRGQQPVRQIRPHRLLQATEPREAEPVGEADDRRPARAGPLRDARHRPERNQLPVRDHDLGHASLGGGERARGVGQPVVEGDSTGVSGFGHTPYWAATHPDGAIDVAADGPFGGTPTDSVGWPLP